MPIRSESRRETPRVQNIKQQTEIINQFKTQWQDMWHNRLDDKIRAEGIAKEDYSLLSVDRGTVIIATRKFKLLDYYELLRQRKALDPNQIIPPNPKAGGWRKFIQTNLKSQNRTKRGRPIPETQKPERQQKKKCGRGWLHNKQ